MTPKDNIIISDVRKLLESQSAMTLATVDHAGVPDATPLFFFPGDDLTLYWLSSTESRHSRNLSTNARVAVTVHAAAERWEDIRGVQMEGTASEVSDQRKRSRIISQYRHRFRLGPLFSVVIAQSTLYQFRPSWIRYLDNSRGFGYQVEVEI